MSTMFRLSGSTPRREWRLQHHGQVFLICGGETHRFGGPAVEFDNGFKQWYWYGNRRMSQGGEALLPADFPKGYDWSDIANFPGYEPGGSPCWFDVAKPPRDEP